MAVLPEISPACREELARAGFKEGTAYMEVPDRRAPVQIHRPAGEPMTYDPSTDTLTISGVRFSPQLIEDFVQAARVNPVGPVLLKAEDDHLVVTKLWPLNQDERMVVATARMGGITQPHEVDQLLAIIDRLTGEALC